MNQAAIECGNITSLNNKKIKFEYYWRSIFFNSWFTIQWSTPDCQWTRYCCISARRLLSLTKYATERMESSASDTKRRSGCSSFKKLAKSNDYSSMSFEIKLSRINYYIPECVWAIRPVGADTCRSFGRAKVEKLPGEVGSSAGVADTLQKSGGSACRHTTIAFRQRRGLGCCNTSHRWRIPESVVVT